MQTECYLKYLFWFTYVHLAPSSWYVGVFVLVFSMFLFNWEGGGRMKNAG